MPGPALRLIGTVAASVLVAALGATRASAASLSLSLAGESPAQIATLTGSSDAAANIWAYVDMNGDCAPTRGGESLRILTGTVRRIDLRTLGGPAAFSYPVAFSSPNPGTALVCAYLTPADSNDAPDPPIPPGAPVTLTPERPAKLKPAPAHRKKPKSKARKARPA